MVDQSDMVDQTHPYVLKILLQINMNPPKPRRVVEDRDLWKQVNAGSIVVCGGVHLPTLALGH